jgi:hypothetical protein
MEQRQNSPCHCLLNTLKVRESALHVSARQYLGMVYGADPEQSASKANYAEH